MNENNRNKQNETGIEIPVATSTSKKWLMGAVIAIATGYLLLKIVIDKPKKEAMKIKENNAEVSLYPMPKLQDNSKEFALSKGKIDAAENKESLQSVENQKLMLLRQHAPIELYSLKNNNPAMNTHYTETNNASDNNIQVERHISDTENSDQTLHSNTQHVEENKNKAVERLKHQDYLLLEGTLIPGILQTAVHSDLAGNIKAMVTEDIYAAKGRRILIPKGSSLLGHYSGTQTSQQSRVVIVWTRIIRPDGISIKLEAQGTDEVGQVGVTGNVNHHYLARFGQASLLSLLGTGIASTQMTSNPNYMLAMADGFTATSKASLQESVQIKSTITIKAGNAIAVYVNQDISFYDVLRS